MSQTYLTEHKAPRRGRNPNEFDLADLLDVIDIYERAFPTSDILVQDSFVLNAIEVLAYEPLAAMPLHPLNWKIGKPNLELEARLTAKGKLALDALPTEEKVQRTAAGWLFEDFESFPGAPRPGARPRFTCFELELEDLEIELRDPGMKVDAELAVRRELVFSSYEYLVRKLALHFNCSVKTGLVCVGPAKRMYIRNMTVADNPVEYANLLTANRGVRWHTRYLTLCKMEGVSPDELLAFFRASLARLAEGEQENALRQYLGKKPLEKPEQYYWHRVSKSAYNEMEPLLGALKVVAHSKAFPPLVDHPSTVVEEVLELVIRKNAPAGIIAFAKLYWMDEADVRKILREYYPRLLLLELTEPKTIVQEINVLLTDVENGLERAVPFLEALVPAIQKEWETFGDVGSFSVRMGKLARRCGFKEAHELQTWAKDHAPKVTDWLVLSRQKDTQRLADARNARKRARSSKPD